jgi:hypothetical protein
MKTLMEAPGLDFTCLTGANLAVTVAGAVAMRRGVCATVRTTKDRIPVVWGPPRFDRRPIHEVDFEVVKGSVWTLGALLEMTGRVPVILDLGHEGLSAEQAEPAIAAVYAALEAAQRFADGDARDTWVSSCSPTALLWISELARAAARQVFCLQRFDAVAGEPSTLSNTIGRILDVVASYAQGVIVDAPWLWQADWTGYGTRLGLPVFGGEFDWSPVLFTHDLALTLCSPSNTPSLSFPVKGGILRYGPDETAPRPDSGTSPADAMRELVVAQRRARADLPDLPPPDLESLSWLCNQLLLLSGGSSLSAVDREFAVAAS